MNRWATGTLGAVAAFAVYVFLAGSGNGALVAYPLALATAFVAWRADVRWQANGWIKLAGLILATLTLLAGKETQGTVPWQYLTTTGLTVLIFALFAVGLNLEFGFGGLINFGHVAFMSLGAYGVTLLALRGGLWAGQPGILVALVLALGGAALAGLLLAVPAIRLRADYLAIVTIAAAEILRRILLNEQGLTQGAEGVVLDPAHRPFTLETIGSWPLVGEPLITLLEWLKAAFGFTGSPYLFVLAALAITATLLVVWAVERLIASPWGRNLRAIREDEDAARALGINPVTYKLQVFAIGSAIAALAGAFWAWQNVFVSPDQFQPTVTFFAWIMIVIGGIGSNKGAVAGAFLFWTIDQLSRSAGPLRELGFDSEQIAAFSTLALGCLLVAFMVLRPQGLFGNREELELVE